jgi:hypothetical protein
MLLLSSYWSKKTYPPILNKTLIRISKHLKNFRACLFRKFPPGLFPFPLPDVESSSSSADKVFPLLSMIKFFFRGVEHEQLILQKRKRKKRKILQKVLSQLTIPVAILKRTATILSSIILIMGTHSLCYPLP